MQLKLSSFFLSVQSPYLSVLYFCYLTVHAHTHTHTHIPIHMHMQTHIHIHTYLYTYTHTYIHIHIHIYSRLMCRHSLQTPQAPSRPNVPVFIDNTHHHAHIHTDWSTGKSTHLFTHWSQTRIQPWVHRCMIPQAESHRWNLFYYCCHIQFGYLWRPEEGIRYPGTA